jgi:ferredoxin
VKRRLAVNPIACTGHGICAEVLPELIGLDEWGYPILADRPVTHELTGLAKRAVRLCPTLALRLESVNADRRPPTGGQRDPRDRRDPAGHGDQPSGPGRHSATGAGQGQGQAQR